MYASIKTIQPHAMIPINGDIIDGDIIDGVINMTIVVPNSKEYKLQIQIKDIRFYDKADALKITLADNILYIHKEGRIISWDLSCIVHSNVRTDEIYFCHKKNIKNRVINISCVRIFDCFSLLNQTFSVFKNRQFFYYYFKFVHVFRC